MYIKVINTPRTSTETSNVNLLFFFSSLFHLWFQKINGAGSFELKILEISNDKNHLIDGYCCGSNDKEKSKTAGCPKCATAFRLCLKEFPGGAESFGCPFGESTTTVLGGSSFEPHGQRFATITVPFTFRWTVSFFFYFCLNDSFLMIIINDHKNLHRRTFFFGFVQKILFVNF